MATVVAAFIGAILGSIGAVVIEQTLHGFRERRRRREALVHQYLFQLQDAVEALWHRVYNVRHEGGIGAMTPEYRQTTTVYALGRVLAAERVLTLEGVYPQLEELYPGLGKTLQGRRLSVGLNFPGLQQYDRIALGEAVLEQDEGGFRPSTYLAFRNRYGGSESGTADWLGQVRDVVSNLGKDTAKLNRLLIMLGEIAHQTSNVTGIPTSITEKEKEMDEAGRGFDPDDFDVVKRRLGNAARMGTDPNLSSD
jgi:hypothetical protein